MTEHFLLGAVYQSEKHRFRQSGFHMEEGRVETKVRTINF